MELMPLMNSSVGIFSLLSSILPLSIRLISRISLINDNRNREEMPILEIQSSTCSSSPMDWAAMVLMPMMAFMGVLISWLIRERKSLLAALACSAATRAAASSSFCLCSFKTTSVTSVRATHTRSSSLLI